MPIAATTPSDSESGDKPFDILEYSKQLLGVAAATNGEVIGTSACPRPPEPEPYKTGPTSDKVAPPKASTGLSMAEIAENIKSGPAVFCLAHTAMAREMPPQAWLVYLNQLLQDAGLPRDPVERMLVEQLALANSNIHRLYYAAANADTIAKAEFYQTAVTRLIGEFRRLTLAIKTYRSDAPAGPQVVNLVGQQNVAENQQVAYVAEPARDKPVAAGNPAAKKDVSETELRSNRSSAISHDDQQQPNPQSQAGGRRQAEPAEAALFDTGRTSAAPEGRYDRAPLGPLNGAALGSR